MRTADEIHSDIDTRFTARTEKKVRPGSIIDLMHSAVAAEMEDAYQEIENNKTPHIYTDMDTRGIERTGFFVNVPRNDGESDNDYLYRIMNWTYLKAAANLTSINDSLLQLTYASNASYHPGVYGAGTGIVYVIPLVYDTETINNALAEVRERVKPYIDPAAYVEYVVPEIIPVKFVIQVSSLEGDIEYIKGAAEDLISTYVNSIPPKEYLEIGNINKLGQTIDNVNYFNTVITYIDSESKTDVRFLQALETKFLYDEIVWEVIS